MAASKLNDEGMPLMVAELYIAGYTHQQIGDEFGVRRETIGVWIKDPRVQAHAARLSMDRVNRIGRKIDKTIEARIMDADNIDTETLLKIRKEYLDRALKVDINAAATEGRVIEETVKALDANPDLGAALKALLEGKDAAAA